MDVAAIELSKRTLTKRIIFGVFCLVGAAAMAGIATVAVGEENTMPRTNIDNVRSLVAHNNIGAKYRFANSKFIKDPKDKNSVQTEVGDSGSVEFKPDLTVSKWNGEASFKVKPDISGIAKDDKKLTIDGERIDYKADAKDYVYYDDPSASENGGFEFKIILNEKPGINTFSEAIESNGVEFYPQLPLNEERQGPGVICTPTECKDSAGRVVLSRAEDVVDSIAVYATGKRGLYRIGGDELWNRQSGADQARQSHRCQWQLGLLQTKYNQWNMDKNLPTRFSGPRGLPGSDRPNLRIYHRGKQFLFGN